MLVFSRRKGQRIVISNEIEIIVTQTSRTSVKIAVRAPNHCSILRGEVFDAIVEANRAAAESGLELPGEPAAAAPDAEPETEGSESAVQPVAEQTASQTA
jgi:carbon storage regulator